MFKSYTLTVLFITLFCVPEAAYTQLNVSGTIIDQQTKAPVPYAYVRKKNTNRGAITNEDGFFNLSCKQTDTLLISFISYDKIEVAATYFTVNDVVYLTPSKNELATVEVFADFEFLYDVFDRARKNLKQAQNYDSKTYFTLETNTQGFPVELLECYYNASIGASGINELSLKNGRIGMSKADNTYYTSLSTTQVISDYRLMNKKTNEFPDNPLQLNKSKLGKSYDLKLLAVENQVYKIDFQPKKRQNEYFNAVVWVDKMTEEILKVELTKKNLKRHPFVQIDPKHEIDSLNFGLAYTFSGGDNNALEKIEFNYDLQYKGDLTTRTMESAGVFLFFEKGATFDLPFYSQTSHKLTDYDKIVSQPYNARFWELNEVLSPSRKAVLYRSYFQKTGVLLNFDELSKRNTVFQNRVVAWSQNRILPDQINQHGAQKFPTKYSSAGTLNYKRAVTPAVRLYNLSAQIYLDRNVHQDSVYYKSETLINLADSYYFLEYNKNTTCFINLYYDMVEIKRREMMEIIEHKKWSANQVDSIYYTVNYQLEKELELFIDVVERGENDRRIKQYVKYIQNDLEIDNSVLIWSDYMAEQKKLEYENTSPWIKLYNHGTALMRIGKYEESLPFYLEAYNLTFDNPDPWLLYNIGINYIKLNEIEKGCFYLATAKAKGEEVLQKLVSACKNDE